MNDALRHKYDRLCDHLRSLERVVVAFSGGADSTLLLKVALDVLGPDRVAAVIADSEILARRELEQARRVAVQLGVALETIRTGELGEPQFRDNPVDRCYHCRVLLFERLRTLAVQRDWGVVVCGANADDPADYRPGLKAAAEFGVVMPLQQAQLTKPEVRRLSQTLNLGTWDKPASPCLATRVPYGQPVTVEKLRQIERGEAFLEDRGFRQCRVRHHGQLVRIEVPAQELARMAAPELGTEVVAFFRELGFVYVTVDLQGFRSGSGNEVLGLDDTGETD